MRQQLRIRTYDSIQTDLAGEMSGWQEFVSGEGYTVSLRDPEQGVQVSVWMTDDPEDFPTVTVEGSPRGALFDRVLGRVIQALSEHSDSLMVGQRSIAEPDAPPNGGPDQFSKDRRARKGHHR